MQLQHCPLVFSAISVGLFNVELTDCEKLPELPQLVRQAVLLPSTTRRLQAPLAGSAQLSSVKGREISQFSGQTTSSSPSGGCQREDVAPAKHQDCTFNFYLSLSGLSLPVCSGQYSQYSQYSVHIELSPPQFPLLTWREGNPGLNRDNKITVYRLPSVTV